MKKEAMVVKFKKLNKNAAAPSRANPMDAGWDLTCSEISVNEKIITYHTGIAVAIPEGYVGLLFPRSSIYKKDLQLANSVGVIDSGYRGEILFKFRKLKEAGILHVPGDRVGQLMIIQIPDFFWDESPELPESVRDTKGHGSSDLLRKISS